jgi:hypothetical protein
LGFAVFGGAGSVRSGATGSRGGGAVGGVVVTTRPGIEDVGCCANAIPAVTTTAPEISHDATLTTPLVPRSTRALFIPRSAIIPQTGSDSLIRS